MFSPHLRTAILRPLTLSLFLAMVLTMLLVEPAAAVLTGSPTTNSGTIKLEVAPVGADSMTPSFAPSSGSATKLPFETLTVGGNGTAGWPVLGTPTSSADFGPFPLPVVLSAPAAPAIGYGGGSMTLSLTGPPTTSPIYGLNLNGTISDVAPSTSASISAGYASATWTNSSAGSLDILAVCSQIVTAPGAGLTEIGLAGNIKNMSLPPSTPDVADYAIYSGIDHSGSRGSPFVSGSATGPGVSLGPSSYLVKIISPTSYLVTGYQHFIVPVVIPEMFQLNATLTLAMNDSSAGNYIRSGPVPIGMPLPPLGGSGVMAAAAEDPPSSTEWTAASGSDFSVAGNFSNGAPISTSEVYFADAPATPAGKMISVTGTHSLHRITVANSTSPNYTIGLFPSSGTFDFGTGGSIEVFTAGDTTNNCDSMATDPSATLTIRVADPSTVLSQHGTVGSPTIDIEGLGTVKFFPAAIGFSSLIANLGTTEFESGLSTSASFSIASGAKVAFIGPATLSAPGTISVFTGGTLNFLADTSVGGSISNDGTINFPASGMLSVTGSVTNTGTINLPSGSPGGPSMFGGSVTNSGVFNISRLGAPTSFSMPVSNTGTIHVFAGSSAFFSSMSNSGTVTIDATADTTIGGAPIYLAGTGTITNSGTLKFVGGYKGTHGVAGLGTTSFVSGPLETGLGLDSTALLSFPGDVVLSSFLLTRLAGTTRGTLYDALSVGGHLTAGGTLDVALAGYAPVAGNSFVLLDWGTLTGTFSTLSLPPLSAGLMWNASKLYTAGSISVQITGDYNGNGVVDGADYVVWRKTLGQTGTGLAADGNGDGTINSGDYDLWRANFGAIAGSGAGFSATGSASAVPEPSTLMLLMFAAAGWCVRRGGRNYESGKTLGVPA
jgi:hypothetical protein